MSEIFERVKFGKGSGNRRRGGGEVKAGLISATCAPRRVCWGGKEVVGVERRLTEAGGFDEEKRYGKGVMMDENG